MDGSEHPDERRQTMQPTPSACADAAAQIERRTEQDGQVAADDARAGERRAVVQGERDRDPGESGMQPPVAQQ
jgi:hypothetical protein